MYINPFLAGVLAVIVTEILFVFIYTAQHLAHDIKEDEKDIVSVNLTEEEKDEFVKFISEIMEKKNGKDNDN